MTGLAGVLVNAASASKRDDAVREMTTVTPDLQVVGASLRAYFVAAPGAPANAGRSPYGNLVDVIAASSSSTQLVLDSAQMRRAEPIRTAELSREGRARQRLLAKRAADGGDSVPARIVAAIDAWLAALQKFSTDALKPDSHELVDRFKSLRNATRIAKDAVADKQ